MQTEQAKARSAPSRGATGSRGAFPNAVLEAPFVLASRLLARRAVRLGPHGPPEPDRARSADVAPASLVSATPALERADPILLDQSLTGPPRDRRVKAREGDSISRLLGSSDPAMIGAFVRRNGLSGRDSVIRAGRTYVVPVVADAFDGEARRAGERLLSQDNRRLAERRAREAARELYDSYWEPDLASARFKAGLNIYTGLPTSTATRTRRPRGQTEPPAPWWDHPVARSAAGKVAFYVGVPLGVPRGLWHTAEGLTEGIGFASRLLNPLDAESSAPGEAAWDQVFGAGQVVGDYVGTRAKAPGMLWDDVQSANSRFGLAMNPEASPTATTTLGEWNRNFQIGMNNGELAFDILSIPFGGAEVKALAAASRMTKAARYEKYLAEGYSPRLAAYFSEKYKGMGHHTLPRRTRLPEVLGGGAVPSVILDSPVFVLKSDLYDNGQMFKLHFGVDDSYYGGGVPRRFGGGGWSARKLGWPKYQGVERLWRGSTTPQKLVFAGGAAGVGAGIDAATGGDDEP